MRFLRRVALTISLLTLCRAETGSLLVASIAYIEKESS